MIEKLKYKETSRSWNIIKKTVKIYEMNAKLRFSEFSYLLNLEKSL